MKNAILFDKFKNRKEEDVPNVEEEIILTEENNEVIYKFQFFDKKRRAVYVEKSRTKLEE